MLTRVCSVCVLHTKLAAAACAEMPFCSDIGCGTLMSEDCEGCGVFICISACCGGVQGPCLRRYALQADLRELDADA
jgi:hypothetical protein